MALELTFRVRALVHKTKRLWVAFVQGIAVGEVENLIWPFHAIVQRTILKK
jgi:hypothetical protein